MAYRDAQSPSERPRPRDLGGLGLLALLAVSGLVPFVPALLSGVTIEGQSAVGFGIALGAVLLAVREWREARAASLPARAPGPVPSRPHVRPLPDPPRHR